MPSAGSGGSTLKGIDNVITIDASDLSKKKLKDLEKEFGDLSVGGSGEPGDSGQELLDLMDAAGEWKLSFMVISLFNFFESVFLFYLQQ